MQGFYKQVTARFTQDKKKSAEDTPIDFDKIHEKYAKTKSRHTKDRAKGEGKKNTLFKHADKEQFKNLF